LTYGYDVNGNRTAIGYPGNVSAHATFDFADRPATLSMQDGLGPVQTLVSTSAYKASGPLSQLTLGNGLSESHAYNVRYFPSAISVAGRLDWTYTTDALGNVTRIDDNLSSGGSRTFGYQDMQYFLVQGDGPWGTRGWTYGKSGDRLSEIRDGVAKTYEYAPNAAGGGSPRLSRINGGTSGSVDYSYDAAGDLAFRSAGSSKLRLTYDSAQQLSQQRVESDTAPQGLSQLAYDSRGFLTSSSFFSFAGSTAPDKEVLPTYDSRGVLYHRADLQHRSPSAPRNQPEIRDDAYVFYFADRPVAVYDKRVSTPTSGSPTTSTKLSYLTTDHLGAPILQTDPAGATQWQGGLEPFGADWNGAGSAGLFLRLPGQWEDPAWKATNLFYNLNRWYDPETGRYTRPDLLSMLAALEPYRYALSNPIHFQDRNGLQALPKPVPPVDPVPYFPPLRPVPPPAPSCPPEVAPLPSILGAAGGWLTVILNEIFNPEPLGGPGIDDFTDPSCKPKCGKCDPAEHGFLQFAVDQACKVQRACAPGMSPKQLEDFLNQNMQCYYARKEINERCYGGGNKGHEQAQKDALNAAKRCLNLLTGDGPR
jgi:RHS repeat-associated protein